MATAEAGAVQQQLEQINAQIPEPVAQRVTAAIAEVEASGAALGLAVGDQAPEFGLPDALGRAVSLRERLSGGRVVLVFYRGEWCPYCNTYLRALQAALPQIAARGASLIAVSPQSPDHSLSITEKAELGFDVLSDVDQAVIRAYKLQFTVPVDLQDVHLNAFHVDLRDHNADRSWQLPVPATFVIGRDGVVRAAQVSADYRTRMEPGDIIAALDDLTS
ncbi:MAG TPA: peroxiredoxin-like family protein [Acidimicrobiales bacterium]|nr:peroxiredoxin-like family protein [Acidimicrobiales bacterium]